jgi:GNAT superfamily N-acetyltransferase
MDIRPITAGDLPAVLEVYRLCEDFLVLGPDPTASMEMIAADRAVSAAQNGEYCGLFAQDGSLMGIFDFVRAGFNGQSNCAFIELLMIAAPARGQGVGAQAVAWLENELQRAGIRSLEAAVQVNNPDAIRFWQNQGFMLFGLPEPQPDGTVTYPLEKIL